MGEVVDLDCVTTLDIPCSKVIEGLQEIDFERILVIGFDSGGDLQIASHTSDLGALLLLMERARDYLLHDCETT